MRQTLFLHCQHTHSMESVQKPALCKGGSWLVSFTQCRGEKYDFDKTFSSKVFHYDCHFYFIFLAKQVHRMFYWLFL